MLLDLIRCTGSIPRELGNLSALQSLDFDDNELTGESNVRLEVSGTFLVSDGAHVKRDLLHRNIKSCICGGHHVQPW